VPQKIQYTRSTAGAGQEYQPTPNVTVRLHHASDATGLLQSPLAASHELLSTPHATPIGQVGCRVCLGTSKHVGAVGRDPTPIQHDRRYNLMGSRIWGRLLVPLQTLPCLTWTDTNSRPAQVTPQTLSTPQWLTFEIFLLRF
jgi:hypothetical protein